MPKSDDTERSALKGETMDDTCGNHDFHPVANPHEAKTIPVCCRRCGEVRHVPVAERKGD